MILTITNLSKTFVIENQRITALTDVNFSIKAGEFFTVIGPSGCGKSTLLRILAGLDQPTEGKITWQGKTEIGFIFQHYALFPYLTVWENVAFGLKMQGMPEAKQHKIIHELLEEVGLTEFKDKHPKELSGGMKQRVGIARSLAIEPDVLLMDEPFSSLDEFTAETLRALTLDLWAKRKMTVILITHLVREALELSDRIAVMTAAPGTVKLIHQNKLSRPRNMRTQEFFRQEDELVDLIKKPPVTNPTKKL